MTNKKYEKPRTTISANIKRKVEVDAGHKCSVNQCLEHTYLEIHHINKNREDNNIENLILLCDKHHKMAHSGIIDSKALKLYKQLLSKNSSFVRSQEGERVHNFLEEIREILRHYDFNPPYEVTYIKDNAGYFFPTEIYEKIDSFLYRSNNEYHRTLRSFDIDAYEKQDEIIKCFYDIYENIRDKDYTNLGLAFKFTPLLPHGGERSDVIDKQTNYIKNKLIKIFTLINLLDEYVKWRG
jgi:hypothetical protein